MRILFLLLSPVIGVMMGAPVLAVAPAPAKGYAALEIARFEVKREDYSSKEAERAGRIPDEALDAIQRVLLTEFTRAAVLPAVGKPGSAQEGQAVLALEGRVVDYLAGSQVKRVMIGMGAGQQKIAVVCVLKDKATGAVLGQETIQDRKWGGLTGGSEDKGMRDFSEKVIKFVQVTLQNPAAPPPGESSSKAPAEAAKP